MTSPLLISEPKLSVVVAAWNDARLLHNCLSSLQANDDDGGTDVIVATNFPAEHARNLLASFPDVTFLWLPKSTTVPELRAAGIRAARGAIIALIEDHCTPDRRWRSEILKAHEEHTHVSIGGAIENATNEGLVSWAVYFYDYGRYMLPCREGESAALSGLNVSYKRAALEDVSDSFHDGFFETFVNERLKRDGHPLYLRPGAVVYHNKSYLMRDALMQCYHLARSFAARRVAGARPTSRVAFALGSLGLPVILPARIVMTVVRKGRHLRELLLSLPHLVALMAGWSLGEFSGYLAGEGVSAAKWK